MNAIESSWILRILLPVLMLATLAHAESAQELQSSLELNSLTRDNHTIYILSLMMSFSEASEGMT